MLRRLTLLLQEGVYTLPEAFEHAAVERASPDQLMRQLADRLRSEPLVPLSSQFLQLAPDTPEKDVLLSLMQRLGRGTQEMRCLACSQACDALALMASAAVQKAEKDAKMWTSLGWTAGACLALMLI